MQLRVTSEDKPREWHQTAGQPLDDDSDDQRFAWLLNMWVFVQMVPNITIFVLLLV